LNLIPIEYQNQRILTTAQLAEQYGTDERRISENFNRNRDRYMEGKHFFALQGEEKRAFLNHTQIGDGSKHASVLYLWTEKGAWLHAKSLNTDRAWEAYEMLVDEYYRIKDHLVPKTLPEALRAYADEVERRELAEYQVAVMTPKAEFFDAVADSKDAIAIGDAAKVLNMGVGRNKLFQILRGKKILMRNNRPYQEFIDRGYFRVIEQKWTTPEGETKISIKTLVYQKGLDFIRRQLQAS
jgi:phage antirepressor YoqD-like protein